MADPRVVKSDQISPSRYHNIVPLSSPRDVDAQLVDWLKTACELVRVSAGARVRYLCNT